MGSNHSRRVEPNEYTVVCYEDHIDCNCLCTYLNFCTKPLKFHTNTASNHERLANLVSNGRVESGNSMVNAKFSNIHQELERRDAERCFKHPICWSIPFWILWGVLLGAAVYLGNAHQVQCEAGKACFSANNTDAQELQCPSTSDWAVDCCYAYCDGCNPIPLINEKIELDKPFKPECNCTEVHTQDGVEKVCGKIKLYGNFKHLPGDYASPLAVSILIGICVVLFIILMIVLLMSGRYEANWVNNLLHNSLKDWILLGITVEFRVGRYDEDCGGNEDIPGHIILRLPSTQVASLPTQYPPKEDNETNSGFTYFTPDEIGRRI